MIQYIIDILDFFIKKVMVINVFFFFYFNKETNSNEKVEFDITDSLKEFEKKLDIFFYKDSVGNLFYDSLEDEEKNDLEISAKKYMEGHLNDKIGSTLKGKLFVIVSKPNKAGFSIEVSIDELQTINTGFRTTNGGDWNRSNQSWLGKIYEIKKPKTKGSISSVKLEGKNKKTTINQDIRPDIQEAITKQRCVVLDISTNIECDHKEGMKDNWRVGNKALQQLDDFQPLSKAVNDAKRSHCKECKTTGKRFDAKKLGFKESFTMGDENSKVCNGCYWYDPVEFNKEISKDFKKNK